MPHGSRDHCLPRTPSRSGLGGSPGIPPGSSQLAGGGAGAAGASAAGSAHASQGTGTPGRTAATAARSPGRRTGVCSLTSGEGLHGEQPGASALLWNHAEATRTTPQVEGSAHVSTHVDAEANADTRCACPHPSYGPGGAVPGRRSRSQPHALAEATEGGPAKPLSGKQKCAVGTTAQDGRRRKGGGATPTFLSG